MSFSALKDTTQAIQSSSRTFEGKKKKENVAVVVAGSHVYPKTPPHPYPQSQSQVYSQAPYMLPIFTILSKTHCNPFHYPHT